MVEDIHQLRVSIKKLRAVWSLIEKINKDKFDKKNHFQIVKNLFKKAGYLREAQLNLAMLKNETSPYIGNYIDFLNTIKQDNQILLSYQIEHFNFDEFNLINSDLKNYLLELSDMKILLKAELFINKVIKKTQKLHALLPNEEKLHDIRIYLKTVNEVLSIMLEIEEDKKIKKLHKNLKKLNEKIGDWHDLIVLQNSIKKYISEEENFEERLYLQIYLEKLNKKQLKKQLKLTEKISKTIIKQ